MLELSLPVAGGRVILCPQCRAQLDAPPRCAACGHAYPALSSIRVLLPEPAAHCELWRRQLGLIVQQGSETPRALRLQAVEPGLGDATRARLEALARAIEAQVSDLARVLGPVLGGPLPPAQGLGLPRGATDYLACVFRDWAWADGQDAENARSLAALRRVGERQALGRILVLGAGACRLAYDLHAHCGATHTAVVDRDPFLLVMAEAVIRGASVALTET
ncbi:MAG TPA: hypothetical protein VIM73_17620, partial [Polyangiaceae bacterium]